MNPSQLFSICSFIVLPCWLTLLVIPEKKWIKYLVVGVVLFLALIYVSQLPTFFQQEEGGFGSLEEVMLLFKNKNAVLAGWIHYLAFDLLVGTWIATNAVKKSISKLLVAPCLLCTFMLGPVGFLLYSILKFVMSNKK
ncbi:MAG: ABA4-like family protein [Bacteroidota bacterium]